MADLEFNQASQTVQIVGGDELFAADVDQSKKLKVRPDGTILEGISFDSYEIAYNSNNDVYTYKFGASIVATVTITYTANNKKLIQSVVRT